MKHNFFKCSIFILIVFLTSWTGLSISRAEAQAPAIEWQTTIGGSAYEELRSIIQLPDSSYICGGLSSSGVSGDKTDPDKGPPGTYDYWVVKLTSSGAIEWQKTIGGSGNDYLHCVRATQDGGYLLGGWSDSPISGDKTEDTIGGHDCWVVKLNAKGDIEWQNTFGGNESEKMRVFEPTPDGGYICGAYTHSGISGDKTSPNDGDFDWWVVKLNSQGDILWQKNIGGNAEDVLRAIYPTPDKGYIVGGYSRSKISGDKTEASMGNHDYWVVKIDSVGNIEWQNTIGGSDIDKCRAMQLTSDGGYLCGGASRSDSSGDKTENSKGNYDYWLVKLNTAGGIEWQKTIGGKSIDIMYAMDETLDHGSILGGYSKSKVSGDKTDPCDGDYDYWVIKVNTTGDIEWQKTIGGSKDDELLSIRSTSDGGYICGGYSNSGISADKTQNSNGSYDFWIVKLAPLSVCTNPQATITPLGNLDICSTGYVNLLANDGKDLTYQWRKDASKILGATNRGYTATATGSYKVKVSNNGCSQISLPVSVTSSCRISDELTSSNSSITNAKLQLYSNPSSGLFTLALKMNADISAASEIEVYNSIGDLVFTKKSFVMHGDLTQEFSLEKMASGIYFVNVSCNQQLYSGKLLVQR